MQPAQLRARGVTARGRISGVGPALCTSMRTNGDAAQAVVSLRCGEEVHGAVTMSAALCLRVLRQAAGIHRAGLKSYGLLIAEPGAVGYPFTATGVVFLDSQKNRRNDPGHRAAFRAQGEYFRQFDDAGFVADSAELLAVCRAIEDSGREIVAPFRVDKEPSDFGISDRDAFQGSELAYTGPEVTPLALVAHGPRRALRRLTHTLHPKAAPTGVGRRARPPDPSDPGLPATHEPVPG